MSNLFQTLLAFLLKQLIGNKDVFWSLVGNALNMAEVAAKATATLVDDAAVAIFQAGMRDDEAKAMINQILDRLLALIELPKEQDADVLAMAEMDQKLEDLVRTLAGKLNIDWQAVLKFFMEILKIWIKI